MREKLAALCHEQWSHWMRYLLSKCTPNDDGTWTIPNWAAQRWRQQTETPYSKLSEREQDSDRKQADKFIALIEEDFTCDICGEPAAQAFCEKCLEEF